MEAAKKNTEKKVKLHEIFLYGPKWHTPPHKWEGNLPATEVEVHGFQQQFLYFIVKKSMLKI